MTTKLKSRARFVPAVASPAKLLESELMKLRSELRQTIQVYSARLEIQLAQAVAALRASQVPEELPRECVHQLRDLTVMVRKRKVKPEKGRRKDLRKIDALITDVHTFLPNGRASSD
ncbi:MAG: hypothetical protein ACXWG0_01935 [Chthoniobacterales bacterium]